jgi:hypothetical protein
MHQVTTTTYSDFITVCNVQISSIGSDYIALYIKLFKAGGGHRQKRVQSSVISGAQLA